MKTIVCLGDSLTFGYGVGRKHCWVSTLGNLLKADILNKGVNGDTTSGMLSRSFRDVVQNAPSHVLIMGGTNDFIRGYSLETVCSNIEELIKEAVQYSINPIVACPIPIAAELAKKLWSPFADFCEVNNKLSSYKDWIIEYSNLSNIRYLDLHSAFLSALKPGESREYYIDGIHPTEKGQKIIEQAIIKSEIFNGLLY